MNCALQDVEVGFREGRRISDQIANICFGISDLAKWYNNICCIIKKPREFQKNIFFCFIDYAKAFDCVDHNKLWKILQEMGIPSTWPASWEICVQAKKQQLELNMEQQTGSKLGKEYVKLYIATLLI